MPSSSEGWRGMRRLVAEIVAAGLTLALLVLALEVAFRDHKTEVDYVLGPLSRADRATLLIVGNSHAGALGTEPLREDDITYNASVGGQDIYRSYLLLREFLPKLPHLREVIVSLDYDAMGYNLSVFNQDWQDRQYYPYTRELYHDGLSQRLMARSAFFRANRDFFALLSTTGSGGQTRPRLLPVAGGPADDLEGCRKRAREHSVMKFKASLIPENTQYVRRIVALGTKHGVGILFLNAPKTACYWANYSGATRRLGRAAILRGLAEHAGRFLDYFEDDGFTSADFLDHDHLSPAGRRRLLQDLAVRTPGTAPPAVGSRTQD